MCHFVNYLNHKVYPKIKKRDVAYIVIISLGSNNHCHQCFLQCPVDAIFSRYDASSKLLQDFLKDLAKGNRKDRNSDSKSKRDGGLSNWQKISCIDEPNLNLAAVDRNVFHNTYRKNLIGSDSSTRSSLRDRYTSTVSSTQSDEAENMRDLKNKKSIDRNIATSSYSNTNDRKPLQSNYGSDLVRSNWQVSSDRCPTSETSSPENDTRITDYVSYTKSSLKVRLCNIMQMATTK